LTCGDYPENKDSLEGRPIGQAFEAVLVDLFGLRSGYSRLQLRVAMALIDFQCAKSIQPTTATGKITPSTNEMKLDAMTWNLSLIR
jgi:hypothetical protein